MTNSFISLLIILLPINNLETNIINNLYIRLKKIRLKKYKNFIYKFSQNI